MPASAIESVEEVVNISKSKPTFTREEVAKHDKFDDIWVIFEDNVMDVTKFVKKHPGGQVLRYYRGQDATEAIRGFHSDFQLIEKYMKPLIIGKLATDSYQAMLPVTKDFRKLHSELVAEGKFTPVYLFYILHLISIFCMEALAVYFAYKWESVLIPAILLAVAQVQAGWLQHDFGHGAVFKSKKLNQWCHFFIISHLKGACSWWWKTKHTRHHAKTNLAFQDPDLHAEPLFSFSKSVVKQKAKAYVPFLNYQSTYWFLFGPPMVTSLLFFVQNSLYMARYGLWVDRFITLSFYIKFDLLFRNIYSSWTSYAALFLLMRILESHWFTWVTSMSHLPMPISKEDKRESWVPLQLKATQNIEGGYFNNWFSGHLNYQIEHHLFPNMPRHRYPEVADRVEALCIKHGIEYRKRGLLQSFNDVLVKLRAVANEYDTLQKTKTA